MSEKHRFPHGQPIDHIGIVVADLAESLKLYVETLGFREAYRERRDAALASLTDLMPAGTRWTVPDGGFYIWVTLPLLEGKIFGDLVERRLKACGVRLIDETPRKGAHGNAIAFLHPKSTGGTLIELCQRTA